MFDFMDEIYGLPPEMQYGAYQAMDYRARMDAYRYQQERMELERELAEMQEHEMRVVVTAQWIGRMYPQLQPDIMRILVGGQKAFTNGFRRAAKEGVNFSQFL